MNIPDGLFPPLWSSLAWLPFLALLYDAVRKAEWRRLQDARILNVFLGLIVVLALAWSLRAGVRPGLNLHLLGATAAILMFGRRLGSLALMGALLAVTFNVGWLKGDWTSGWQSFALNALCLAWFPAAVSHLVLRFVERVLPANLFVYLFCAAFFNAGITVFATGLLTSALFWGAGVYTAEQLAADYLPYYFMLAFAESWMNGTLVTLMVVYKPHWVATFDDRRYLRQKKGPSP
ncbi:MAG: energy-coupling factor ABC transporter permease [Rhodocyclaceae bacterium]|nr:energy-coupling factor ABC transporter permease [Rhodocyclaceae bacterium]